MTKRSLTVLGAGLDDLEDLVLGHTANLGKGHIPLARLLLPLLLDHVAENLGPGLALAVHKVGGNGTLRNNLIISLLAVLLLMHLDPVITSQKEREGRGRGGDIEKSSPPGDKNGKKSSHVFCI